MVSTTYTSARTAEHPRSVPGPCSAASGGQRPQDAGTSQVREWPDDTQVWNWATGVVLSGYGPAASNFV
ncbi:hypothetical protein ACFTXM_44860 [Streptomyces sp. NPDC056930]|uniref:hypothetical protein n=1 Tax=Streptomyces sp. NPDC056930 TaxID=3345967 RepID=UPI00362E116B